tara:strand:- start:74 stop:538 length:465 start_codon:yes stop_codon:yes gene_type:complete
MSNSKKTPAWIKNGWNKPGPKQPHSANYVKADKARQIKTGLRQPGQWISNFDDDRNSRVLFTDESNAGFHGESSPGTSIHLHPGDESRGSVCARFLRAHKASKQGKLLFDEPQQVRMTIQREPDQFPVHALERVVRILQGRIAQINKKSQSQAQ